MAAWIELYNFVCKCPALVFFGLLLSQSGLLFCTSPFSVWAFLVLSTLCSVCYFKSYLSSAPLVVFFISSVIGGLLFLAGLLLLSSSCWVSNIGLLLKLGLSPFHFWAIRVVSFLFGWALFVFLGLLKLGPMFLLLNSSSNLFFWGLISLAFGFFVTWTSNSACYLLLGSGALLFCVLVTLSSSTLCRFFCAYILSLLLCCDHDVFSISSLMAWVSMAGLPPFPFFLSKVLALMLCPFFSGLLVLLVGGVTLFPYVFFGLCTSSRFPSSLFTLSCLCFSWALLLGLCLPVL